MPPSLLIRADASPEIGSGHISRCLALGHGWRAIGGGSVTFVAAEMPASLANRIRREGMSVEALAGTSNTEQVVRIARRLSTTHVALDGYHLSDHLEQSLADAGYIVLAMDDFGHARHQSAHIVVNQNIHADRIDYGGKGTGTRLLLGTQYVLLRREFWDWRDRPRRRREPVRRLLVTTGGGDASGFAERALDAVNDLPIETRLIVGASNPRAGAIQRRARAIGVEVVIDAQDMPAEMDAADVALAAAGTTCWELLFMGVPALVVAISENQRAVGYSLRDTGTASFLGWHEDLDAGAIRQGVESLLCDNTAREAFSVRGPALVDGRGAERVARVLKDYGKSLRIYLRSAITSDEHYVWLVNNQPSARRTAIHTAEIPYTTHVEWFAKSLQNPDRLLLIATIDETPVGVVRFDRSGDHASISIALDAGYQGVGLGARVIGVATHHCCDVWSITRVIAYVRGDNLASIKAFTKAGFRPHGSARFGDVEVDAFAYDTSTAKPVAQ